MGKEIIKFFHKLFEASCMMDDVVSEASNSIVQDICSYIENA